MTAWRVRVAALVAAAGVLSACTAGPSNRPEIITNDGQVTLRGPVKTEEEKKAIEGKAKQVAGVKNVENQLEIASN